ncbi:MAG: glycosyltransferase [Anaerolineae bacterium]
MQDTYWIDLERWNPAALREALTKRSRSSSGSTAHAESLPPLFDALLDVEAKLGERGCALELIFVDDGSGDSSLEILLALRARRPGTKVIRLARNFGAIPASKVGLRYVTGHCFYLARRRFAGPARAGGRDGDRWLAGAKYVIAERSSRHDPLGARLFASLYYRPVRLLAIHTARGGFDMILLDSSLIYYLKGAVNTSIRRCCHTGWASSRR